MEVERFAIEGVVRLVPPAFEDARGIFSETYSEPKFAGVLGPIAFVQDNVSISRKRGTLRGLHFQKPPMAQSKLVRVVRGAIFDVAVDVRNGSPTYGEHVGVELRASDRSQLFVPRGFLHGFCTLEDDTEVFYKVDAPYSPEHDGAVHWADPDLAIAWPVNENEMILSEKDARAPRLRDLEPLLGERGF